MLNVFVEFLVTKSFSLRVKMVKICLGYFTLTACVGIVLLGPPLPTVGEKAMMCEKEFVDSCMENIQIFLRLTSLPFTSEENKLDKLCERAISGYNCSYTLSKGTDCLLQKDKDMLPIFLTMAEFMFLVLCGSGESLSSAYLRQDFLSNSECILKNMPHIKCCAKETNVPDLPVMRILEESGKSLAQRQVSNCCNISRYLQCTSTVAEEKCGQSASNMTSEYIRRAAGEQVQALCQNMPYYPEPDPSVCMEPVTTCSGCLRIQVHSLTLISLGLLFVWVWMSRH